MGKAETHFREAFERLKTGNPKTLPKGSKVTQNNVAREAGVDPSALRKSRFPELVEEIKSWKSDSADVYTQHTSSRQSVLSRRARNRNLREQLLDVQAERDDAMSKLVDAERHIISLTLENQRLQASLPSSNVAPIRPADLGKQP